MTEVDTLSDIDIDQDVVCDWRRATDDDIDCGGPAVWRGLMVDKAMPGHRRSYPACDAHRQSSDGKKWRCATHKLPLDIVWSKL